MPWAAPLEHHVADIVDDIDVVAGAAGHGVGADAAVEEVVAAVAVKGVVALQAEYQIVTNGAEQGVDPGRANDPCHFKSPWDFAQSARLDSEQFSRR